MAKQRINERYYEYQTRADLRGSRLDDDCRTAKVTTNEMGEHDRRVFCRGLIDPSTDAPFPKCIQCGAWVTNLDF